MEVLRIEKWIEANNEHQGYDDILDARLFQVGIVVIALLLNIHFSFSHPTNHVRISVRKELTFPLI